jgi:hypothetical protein
MDTFNTQKDTLQFTQSNLQDFLDCPRRFQLKTLDKRSWPAAYSLPILEHEIFVELGNQFHVLSHQFFSGVSPVQILSTIEDSRLIEMWDKFLPFAQSLYNLPHYSEQILAVDYHGTRLAAKYDLVVQHPDLSYQIIDWKTSAKPPSAETLLDRVQTYLYPLVFLLGSSDLFSSSQLEPAQIRLSYWYPLAAEPEICFHFSPDAYNEASTKIKKLLVEIDALQSGTVVFPLTDELSRCQFCPFRSLCGRGDQAGLDNELEIFNDDDLSEWNLDDDQIIELEF